MIELTVKTLDSQNHKFSIPDDVTVKQFKEKIADAISVPADSQRLIYCGRVLQDDKNLSEYDVNGKVIHLVQRAPPQPSPGTNSNNVRRQPHQPLQQPTNSNHRRIHYHHHHYHRQPRFDGNTMYFGAMAIPADLIEEQGVRATVPQGFSRTQTRIVLAQQMLNRAQDVLTRLENPDTSSPDVDSANEEPDNSSNSSAGESSSNGGGAGGGGGPGAGAQQNGQANSISGSIMQAAQAATAAAIAAAVSAVQAAGLPNITIMREPQQGADNAETGTSDELGRGNGAEDQNHGGEGFQNATSSGPTEDSGMAEDSTRRTIEAPRTTALAEVLDLLAQTNARLQPFLQQYQNLMQTDPAADANGESAENMQRVFNSVSEVMHYLSHAYHAMSDILCNFSQAPPRNLRSWPVVIQHSAVLQAGIPIQAQINVMGNRSASNSGSQQQSPSESTPPANNTAPATSQNNEPSSQSESAPPQPSAPQRQQTRSNRSQAPTGLPPVVSISPGNVEFFMELGQGGAIDSIQVVANRSSSSASGSESTTSTSSTTQQHSFSWARPPSAELIENLMQAMAGQMMMGRGTANSATVTINGSLSSGPNARNRSSTGTTSSSTATTSTAASTASSAASTASSANATASGGGGQNSQARGNTATHPTTSTQTRSTSRPHVQIAPAALQGLGTNSFDPFLPCNSHHLNSPRRRSRPQQSTPNTANTEQQAQATAPVTAEPTQPETSEQNNMSRLDLLIAFMNHWLGSGGSRNSSTASDRDGEASASSGEGASPGQGRTFVASDLSDDGLLDQLNVPLELSWLGLLNQLRQSNSQNEAGQNRMPVLSLEMFCQLIQGATSMLYQQSPTVADFLQTVPDYSYSEGESFLTDLIMLVARNMTFENMIALSVGHSRALDRMQPQLNEFVLQRVLLGQLPTQERISEAVNRILLEIQPPADILEAAHIREDVDLMASINKFCQVRIAELIRLILTKSNPGDFGCSLMSLCSVILMELTSLLLNCCDGGEREVEAMLQIAVRHLTSGVHPELQRWTINSSLTRFRNYVTRINARSIDVQDFIVYHSSARAEASSEKPSSSPKDLSAPEPMETDSAVQVPLVSAVVENGVGTPDDMKDIDQVSDDVIMETESLSDVLLQSESWPSSLPSDWVPIIARDSIRQRRQGPQPPFSDVYLAGMPSKRRKVVSNSKRRGNVSQIISERVRHAVEASGVGTSVSNDGNGTITGPEQLGQAAGGDVALQQAYREQVLVSLRQRVHSDPDFNPERFPNTTSYLLK